MTQSGAIAAALVAAFVVYLAMTNRLSAYYTLLTGGGSSGDSGSGSSSTGSGSGSPAIGNQGGEAPTGAFGALFPNGIPGLPNAIGNALNAPGFLPIPSINLFGPGNIFSGH